MPMSQSPEFGCVTLNDKKKDFLGIIKLKIWNGEIIQVDPMKSQEPL